MAEGIILKLIGGNYYVETREHCMYKCRSRGKFRNLNISPLVGDKVIFDITENGEGYLMKVLPRTNELYRPKVANVDNGIIVTSVSIPGFSYYLLDKLIVLLELNNIEPIILFTKCDENQEFDSNIIDYYQKIGYSVFKSNNNFSYDLKMKEKLQNTTSILVGQTGAGKTTFINNLDCNLNLKTAVVSKALKRGKHTTRHVEIFSIENIRIIDSPGFSTIEFIDDLNAKDISRCYLEFEELSVDCRFSSCMHINEPECNVKNNLTNVYIKNRYDTYTKIINEIKR
ncbi:MAG: ribosome small subunit-dependent GTPase A [Bacilli bacterium]